MSAPFLPRVASLRSKDDAKIHRELIRKNLVPAQAWFALLDVETEQRSALDYKAQAGALEQAAP